MDSASPPTYAELVDLAKLQSLMESFSRALGTANAVFAPDGSILARAGWVDACTRFHRQQAENCRRCIESDTWHMHLLAQGRAGTTYTCANGLLDAIAPIEVDGHVVATVLTGQFFTAPPDLEHFRRQAREFGFDEAEYLDAIRQVPVFGRERAEELTQMYARLAATLAEGGLQRLRYQRANAELQRLNKELEDRVAARTAELAASEERLRLALNIGSAGWFELHIPTGAVVVSPEYVRLLGQDPDQFQTSFDYWFANVHPDDQALVRKVFQEGIRRPGVSEATYRRQQKSGEWLWVTSVAEVVEWSPDGRPLRLIGVHRDVTLRKHHEAELERYRAELERLLHERTTALDETTARLALTLFAMERAGVGIAWNDPATGRFVHVNQECSRQFGYSTDEMQRMSIPELNPDHPPDQYHATIAAIRASPNGLTFQTVHRRKDGSCYPAEVTAYVTGSATREWLISFFYDITARKAAEAELIQARDAAENASRTKNAFLATVSHELRTPLNAMIGFSSLIRDGVLGTVSEQQAHPLDIIHRSGQQLLDLVTEILDLTSIEAGNLKVEVGPQGLRPLLEEQCESLQVQAAERGIELRPVQCDEILEVLVDRRRFSQVMRNLLSNAVKFTDTGHVAVTARRISGDVRINVQDTGIGIAPDQLSLLFQPFARVRGSSAGVRPGTGLGLAICRRIVEAMGGQIGVDSTVGQGSRFWFTVPAAPAGSSRAASAAGGHSEPA